MASFSAPSLTRQTCSCTSARSMTVSRSSAGNASHTRSKRLRTVGCARRACGESSRDAVSASEALQFARLHRTGAIRSGCPAGAWSVPDSRARRAKAERSRHFTDVQGRNLYKSTRWVHLRSAFLARHPFCGDRNPVAPETNDSACRASERRGQGQHGRPHSAPRRRPDPDVSDRQPAVTVRSLPRAKNCERGSLRSHAMTKLVSTQGDRYRVSRFASLPVSRLLGSRRETKAISTISGIAQPEARNR